MARWILNKYVEVEKNYEQMKQNLATKAHEIPILGDFNIIAGGFSRGGFTHASKKRYVRSVMPAVKIKRSMKTSDIVFSNEDLKGLIPHKDDPIVLLVIMMRRNVHRVLIDQGNLNDVMFWENI